MPDRPWLSLWLASHQACPKCGRACNVEHVGFEESQSDWPYAIAMLYCEACERGFEILYQYAAGRWVRQFHIEHGPHKPEAFENFKRRLAEVTVVVA